MRIFANPMLQDENRTFRTRLVAMWMLTNATLAILIENISGRKNETTSSDQIEKELRDRQDFYFRFILWATFGLSAVRFIGVSVDPSIYSDLI